MAARLLVLRRQQDDAVLDVESYLIKGKVGVVDSLLMEDFVGGVFFIMAVVDEHLAPPPLFVFSDFEVNEGELLGNPVHH